MQEPTTDGARAGKAPARFRTPPENAAFRLYGQRIEPLRGEVHGLQFEVLLRLIAADGALRSPGAFIRAAERFGHVVAIDEMVLGRVLSALIRHPAQLDVLRRCHVNVSGRSAATPRFRDYIEAALDAHPALCDKLCFELTETASIERLPDARAFAESVRRRGCLVALDDFGSGLSSFAYLKELPIDIVKIDGRFVRDITSDRFDRAVVGAIAEVCRVHRQTTIAEWAESAAIVDCLRDIGVDAAQGYAIHRPCPLEELLGGLLVTKPEPIA